MQTDNQQLPDRKYIRWNGFDYTEAQNYFITIVIQERQPLLGYIDENGNNVLNNAGLMIENTINAISNSFKETYIPYYVVMPNHVHLLIGNNGQHYIPEMMRWFKNITTNKYIKGVKELGWKSFNKKLWQRNYYDHIIRTQKSYNFIVDYIETNPLKWADDQFYIQ